MPPALRLTSASKPCRDRSPAGYGAWRVGVNLALLALLLLAAPAARAAPVAILAFGDSLTAGFGLSVETERVSVPAGESFEVEVQAARREYDGPIHLGLIGLPEGFTVTNAVIPAKTNVVKLQVTIPEELALGDLLHFGIVGNAMIGETNCLARASTLPALRNLFPGLRYPPRELDGLIALSVAASKSTEATSPPKKRKK